ncbi:Cytochrome P450 2L1 [Penaeus vannamei]|uniref:Cytochrome P450 2L1 n=1 Tax=Penaeus vannamei TaxID=6689 RepID=A0A423TEP9_PENVA|nr:Cytochrome P450 2L1 [Penaeus vannamei]
MEARKDDPESTMSIEDLLFCLSDLFVAGSETVSSTIRWAIHYLAKYPEVQAKVQKEIDSVVPRDVPPSIQQKNRYWVSIDALGSLVEALGLVSGSFWRETFILSGKRDCLCFIFSISFPNR